MITEKHLNIAVKMLNARKACKQLYRDEYKSKMDSWVKVIKNYMKKHSVDELGACLIMLQELEKSDINGKDFSMLLVLASTLELIDPEEN
jgi:hypothetical protein